MRAAVLTASKSPLVIVDDHAEPADGPGPLISVTACGVCHSDLHVADGDFGKAPPIILGHEVTGIHDQLGPVMMYAPWGCKSCSECDQGLEMICSNATEAGLFTDGGYAERLRVPDVSYLAPLDGLDPYDAAPLACGGLTAYRAVLQGVDRLRERGSAARALVLGAGGLGQYAIRYLRLLTDAQVVAVDLSATKRETALDTGAHEAVENASVAAVSGKFDLVIDFIGADATLEAAASVVAKLGVVAVVGLAAGSIPFGFGIVPGEARFVSSVWGSRTQLDELLDLARREPDLVTKVEVLPLADAQLAHDRLRAGDVRGRIVLDIDSSQNN